MQVIHFLYVLFRVRLTSKTFVGWALQRLQYLQSLGGCEYINQICTKSVATLLLTNTQMPWQAPITLAASSTTLSTALTDELIRLNYFHWPALHTWRSRWSTSSIHPHCLFAVQGCLHQWRPQQRSQSKGKGLLQQSPYSEAAQGEFQSEQEGPCLQSGKVKAVRTMSQPAL